MEQGREAKGGVQVEVRAEAVLALVVAVEAEFPVQDLVETASAPIVVQKQRINYESPATSRNAQTAARS
jgi:hypothetical protein